MEDDPVFNEHCFIVKSVINLTLAIKGEKHET